ncbi:hypothetical protein QT397_13120 [Microbulbifer sp. MKSA007]|nr:hypothetical protein QT397_13120 [Microbulbifer sp. MKSA007]
MERFTNSIRKNLETENWYGALFMALTMPDICGKITYPEIEHSGPRYKEWFNANLSQINKSNIMGKEVVFLTASDCWALRCSLLHAGTDDITEQRAQEVLEKFEFTTLGMHRIHINNILTLNIKAFCNEVIQAVEAWYEPIAETLEVKEKIARIISIKTEPFSPIPGIQFE